MDYKDDVDSCSHLQTYQTLFTYQNHNEQVIWISQYETGPLVAIPSLIHDSLDTNFMLLSSISGTSILLPPTCVSNMLRIRPHILRLLVRSDKHSDSV
jgi:hypothetical protein